MSTSDTKFVYPVIQNRYATSDEIIVYSVTTSLALLVDVILIPWYISRSNMSPIKQRPIVATLLHRMMALCVFIVGLSRIIPERVPCGVNLAAWAFACTFGAIGDYIRVIYVYVSYFTCKDLVSIYDKFGDDDTISDDSKSATSAGNSGFMASASLFARIKKMLSGKGIIYLAVGSSGSLLLLTAIILAANPDYSMQKVSDYNCGMGEAKVPPVAVLLIVLFVVPFIFFMRGKMKQVQDNFGLKEEFDDLSKATAMLAIIAITTLIPDVYGYAMTHFIYFEILIQFGSVIASITLLGTPIKESYQEKYKVYNVNPEKVVDSRGSTTNSIVPSKADTTGAYIKFADFLNNPSASKSFEDFMVRELNVENLLFYRAVQMYKQKGEFSSGSLPQLKKFAERIYKNFIDPASPSQVNLPSVIVDTLHRQLFGQGENKADIENDIVKIKTVYQPAEYEIIRLMFLDSFSRFSKTKEYQVVEKEFPQFANLL